MNVRWDSGKAGPRPQQMANSLQRQGRSARLVERRMVLMGCSRSVCGCSSPARAQAIKAEAGERWTYGNLRGGGWELRLCLCTQ